MKSNRLVALNTFGALALVGSAGTWDVLLQPPLSKADEKLATATGGPRIHDRTNNQKQQLK